jgi:hypothetical protein
MPLYLTDVADTDDVLMASLYLVTDSGNRWFPKGILAIATAFGDRWADYEQTPRWQSEGQAFKFQWFEDRLNVA